MIESLNGSAEMNFRKLVSLLKFDTDEGALLLEVDEKISESFPQLYDSLLSAYLDSVEKCIRFIREMSTKVFIYEELLGLWFCLKLSVLRMHREYLKRGIDEEYFVAAVANVHRYIAATKDSSGRFGIITERYVRALGHLIELDAFRVGDFNFEFINIDCDIDYNGNVIKRGDKCLSVHIPINTDISDANVDYNFSLAREFFKNHFGMENVFCQLHSWLIHPSVAECLPRDSKLVSFAKRFMLYEITNSPISPIEYVFGINFSDAYRKGERNFDKYPENTSLQRKFKARLIQGMPLGCAKGITLL